MMKELKELVEDIVKYTTTWSITETELYWNIECTRKPNCIKDDNITWEEFKVAFREEILYDLVFNKGCGLYDQMENDLCNYSEDYGDEFTLFTKESKELESKVQKYICDFVLERHNEE